MNVSLTDKLEEFVNRLVSEGRYRSASEVVREGLRLLEIRESQLNSEEMKKADPKTPKKSH